MLGLLTFTCSVVCLLPQAYSNKLRLAALEVPGFIFLWCLGAQRKGMVINMDQVKIGKFIAQMRKEQNLTQRGLADKLSISDKTVSKWERGVSQS